MSETNIASAEDKILENNMVKQSDMHNAVHTEHFIQHFHFDFMAKHPEIKKHEILILWIFAAILVLFLCISVTFNFTKDGIIEEDESLISALNTQLEAEKTNNAALTAKEQELDNKIIALSETVSIKNEEASSAGDELRQLKVPAGYPIKGTSAIISVEEINNPNQALTDENTDEDNQEAILEEDIASEEKDESVIDFEYKDKPYTMFSTGNDTTVVATGLGKVIAITQDSEFGYAIKIDHENGYYSIYRGYGVPLVTVGDTVSRGCILMSVAADNRYFLYQIMYEGEYTDPMDIIEING